MTAGRELELLDWRGGLGLRRRWAWRGWLGRQVVGVRHARGEGQFARDQHEDVAADGLEVLGVGEAVVAGDDDEAAGLQAFQLPRRA